MKSLILAIMALFTSFAHASDLEYFKQRFLLKRNEQGVLVQVVDRSLQSFEQQVRSKEFIIDSLKDLLRANQLLQAQGLNIDLSAQVKRTLSSNQDSDFVSSGQRIIAALDSDKIQQLIDLPQWPQIFERLDQVVESYQETFATLAYPQNKLYFYKRHVAAEISKGITSLVKSVLPFGAWLDIVNFLSKRFIDLLMENKRYHHNILLSYLQTYSASDLGMGQVEKNKVLSSLMDEEVNFYAVWDLFGACKNWPGYGQKRYSKKLGKISKAIKKHAKHYRSIDEQWGDYFYLATNKKGKQVVLNFADGVYYFTSFPSTSIQLERRWAYVVERSVYELTKFAIRFLPWGFVSTVVDPLLNIRYKSQIEHEGALWAQIEGEGNDPYDLAKDLLRQTLNPFIALTAPLKNQTGTNRVSGKRMFGDLNLFLH